jgi:hypothetical protein
MTVPSDGRQKHRPLFDVHPITGATILVFYGDDVSARLGTRRAGWFWWSRRRGFSLASPAVGPFPTRYSAYRSAMKLNCHETASRANFGLRRG